MRRGVPGLAILVCACTHGVTNVQQAGTVPAPRAMSYDGQPLDRGARVEGRLRTVVQETTPLDADGGGNFVARTHSGVGLRGGVGDTDVGVEAELAWTEGAQPASRGLGEPPEYDFATTITGSVRHSFGVADGVRLGVGLESGFTSVPVRLDGGKTEYDEAVLWGFSLVPSWRSGPVTIFFGMHASTETNVPRTVLSEWSFDIPEAKAAGGVAVWNAGVSWAAESGLRLTASAGRPYGAQWANHGLQVDLAIGYDFGRKPDLGGRGGQPQVINAVPAPPPPPPPPPAPY